MMFDFGRNDEIVPDRVRKPRLLGFRIGWVIGTVFIAAPVWLVSPLLCGRFVNCFQRWPR